MSLCLFQYNHHRLDRYTNRVHVHLEIYNLKAVLRKKNGGQIQRNRNSSFDGIPHVSPFTKLD